MPLSSSIPEGEHAHGITPSHPVGRQARPGPFPRQTPVGENGATLAVGALQGAVTTRIDPLALVNTTSLLPAQRLCVIGRMDSRPDSATAAALGISEGAVRAHISVALEKVQNVVHDCSDHDPHTLSE